MRWKRLGSWTTTSTQKEQTEREREFSIRAEQQYNKAVAIRRKDGYQFYKLFTVGHEW
jgi:hypothetical protein